MEITQEQKLILRNLKRILNSENTTLPSLRNVEWRIVKAKTNKVNQVLAYISTFNITELNELIYAGAKLACEKIGIPSKNTKEKSKPGWEFQLEIQIKNLRKQLKVIKQEKRWNKWEQKRKDNTGKTYDTTWGNIPESTSKRKKVKKYRQRIKQYRQRKIFQNNVRKFYQELGGYGNKTYQQPDAKETERFWTKIW